jgi:hypothetical protein
LDKGSKCFKNVFDKVKKKVKKYYIILYYPTLLTEADGKQRQTRPPFCTAFSFEVLLPSDLHLTAMEEDLGLSLGRPGLAPAKILGFWVGNPGSVRPKIGSQRPKS